MHAMTIEEALSAHEDSLMAMPGVQSVGIGERQGKPVIQVFVDAKTPDKAQFVSQIPTEIEGYTVVVDEIGTIRPLHAD